MKSCGVKSTAHSYRPEGKHLSVWISPSFPPHVHIWDFLSASTRRLLKWPQNSTHIPCENTKICFISGLKSFHMRSGVRLNISSSQTSVTPHELLSPSRLAWNPDVRLQEKHKHDKRTLMDVESLRALSSDGEHVLNRTSTQQHSQLDWKKQMIHTHFCHQIPN